MSHTYHFPTLWTGKSETSVVAERHDIALFFDATNCNPNGDPDTGNMPRLQPDTLRGLVTDVCLKRKVRNFWGLNPPAPSGYDIFIKESAILGNVLQSSHDKLIARLCRELITELEQNQFLSSNDAQEITDSLANKDCPKEPADCAKFVTNLCKGKFDCTPLAATVGAALTSNQGFPSESRHAIASTALTDEQRKDPSKAAKAIEKAASDAAPRGTKPQVKTAVQEALTKSSPDSLLEARFSKIEMERLNRDALCQTFIDVRAFGAVVSTDGPLSGSFYGQIRGPLQITFAESLDKILQLDFSITRCAVASEPKKKDADDAAIGGESSDNRTMGRKHLVPYGLYRCHIHFSPAFAAKTGFTYGDLDNFLFALTRMMGDYGVDGSSARPGGMRVVGLVDFQHSTALGNAPAHKLFSLVTVERLIEKTDGEPGDFPRDINDYSGTAPDGDIYTITNPYGLVTGCTSTKPAPKDGNQPQVAITARRLIWDIPAADPSGAI